MTEEFGIEQVSLYYDVDSMIDDYAIDETEAKRIRGADVLLLPERLTDSELVFPDSTASLLQFLEEESALSVEVLVRDEDYQPLMRRASDIWLPVIQIAIEMMPTVVNLLMAHYGGHRSENVLHAKFLVDRGNGRKTQLEVTCNANDLPKVLEEAKKYNAED